MSRRGRGTGGQAAVELVLVLPLVLLVALAALQVALVARDQVLVVHAAREGARAAALGGTDAEAAETAAAATGLRPAALQIHTERDEGGLVRVRATYSSPATVPLVGGMVGSVRLTAAVTMRLER